MHAVIPACVCVFAYECVKALTAFDSNLWNEAAAASQVLTEEIMMMHFFLFL